MAQFDWKITQIETMNEGDLENVVVTVCFDIDATEDGLKGFVQGDTKLLPPDAQDFVALPDITEAQVIAWTKEALGEAGIARFEGMAQQQIDNQKVEQPKAVALPWATEEAA